jgi:hypothetical protein
LINPHYLEERQRRKDENQEDYKMRIQQLMQVEHNPLLTTGIQGNSIIQDTVANKKYKCYYSKCRKSFLTIQLLIQHEKIHVSRSNN